MNKITLEVLKSKNPCKDGYIEVLEKCGNSFSLTFDEAIKLFPQYDNWIHNNLYEFAEVTYYGKFKVGQQVYYSYGPKHYRRCIIDEIKYHSRHGKFYLGLRWPGDNYCCTHPPVDDPKLFFTFADMKLSWIEEINNYKET